MSTIAKRDKKALKRATQILGVARKKDKSQNPRLQKLAKEVAELKLHEAQTLVVANPPSFKNTPKFRSLPNGACEISNREFVANYLTPATGNFIAYSYSANPGLNSSFPWLQPMASGFEYYTIESISAVLVTKVGSTAIGNFYCYWEGDVDDTLPSSQAAFLQNFHSESYPFWINNKGTAEVHCPKKQLIRLREYLVKGSGITPLNTPCKFIIGSEAGSYPQANPINIFFKYTIKFWNPQSRLESSLNVNALNLPWKYIVSKPNSSGYFFGSPSLSAGPIGVDFASAGGGPSVSTLLIQDPGRYLVIVTLFATGTDFIFGTVQGAYPGVSGFPKEITIGDSGTLPAVAPGDFTLADCGYTANMGPRAGWGSGTYANGQGYSLIPFNRTGANPYTASTATGYVQKFVTQTVAVGRLEVIFPQLITYSGSVVPDDWSIQIEIYQVAKGQIGQGS